MTEIIFLIEDALEGGFIAKAVGESIFTEGEPIDKLKENIKKQWNVIDKTITSSLIM